MNRFYYQLRTILILCRVVSCSRQTPLCNPSNCEMRFRSLMLTQLPRGGPPRAARL